MEKLELFCSLLLLHHCIFHSRRKGNQVSSRNCTQTKYEVESFIDLGTHRKSLVSGISSSSGKDVIGKVLFADNRSSHYHQHHHHQKATKRPQAFPHQVLKFRDLPPWTSQKTFYHQGGKNKVSYF